MASSSLLNALTARLRVTVSMIHWPTFAASERTRVAPTIMNTAARTLFSRETTRSPNPAEVDVVNE